MAKKDSNQEGFDDENAVPVPHDKNASTPSTNENKTGDTISPDEIQETMESSLDSLDIADNKGPTKTINQKNDDGTVEVENELAQNAIENPKPASKSDATENGTEAFDDPNKTINFVAGGGTVDFEDEPGKLTQKIPDPNKTIDFISGGTVEFEDDEDDSFIVKENNKTLDFGGKNATVEFDGDQVAEEAENEPPPTPLDSTSTVNFTGKNLTIDADNAPAIDPDGPTNPQSTISELTSGRTLDLDQERASLNLDNFPVSKSQEDSTSKDPKEDTVDEDDNRARDSDDDFVNRTVLSEDVNQTVGSGSSKDYDDSLTDVLSGPNKIWGKQDFDVSPMTSLEAPARSKRLIVEPKLNDRIVVADGELDEVGNPDFRVVSFLGSGAMGEVFVARQTSVDRDVAFKKQIKKSHKSKRKQVRDRNKFLFEAQITANLDHPNIVAIHDMGRDQHGDIFYCMELVRGDPWDQVIASMSVDDNLEVLLKVINGISYAHSKNTIHRDLKPENIMLGNFGEVLIMDWGLGVNLSDGPPQSMGGTPGFMAPEMARLPESDTGKHSDIYLLGAILFMITTGKSPHPGRDVWVCLENAAQNIIIDASALNRDIDQRLLDISLKAMETKPEDRYASPELLRNAIENYQSNLLSIKLSERSEVELKTAVDNQDYEFFSKSMFGFRESLSLWDGNASASDGLQRSRLAYAQCAYERKDHELGMSLLDENSPTDAPLLKKLKKGAAASEQRRRLVWLTIASSIILLTALVITSMLSVRKQSADNQIIVKSAEQQKKLKIEAQSATVEAKAALATAEDERQRAEDERQRAKDESKRAKEAEIQALNAAIAEETQRKRAEKSAIDEKNARETAESLAVSEKEARKEAEAARKEAEDAQRKEFALRQKAEQLTIEKQASEKSARQRLFQSNIGLIDGNIRDNQIEQAIDTLMRVHQDDSQFVNWEWNRLYHLCHTEVKSESIDDVAAIDQSDDGTVAVVSYRGMAKIWNPKLGSTPQEFQVASGKAFCVSLSPNGKLAAIGSADPDRKLTIWDLESGQMAANLSTDIKAGLVSCVAFNDAGTQLAVGDSARTITLFDGGGANWQAGKQLTFHSKRPVDLDYSADGRQLASVSNAGLSIVWDTLSGKPFSAFQHPSQFRAVKFHPGPNKLVACATDDREVVFWNASITNNPIAWQNLSPANLKTAKTRGFAESLVTHESVVNDLDFSVDGKTMVTCGDDRTIAVWKFDDRTLIKRFRGHVNAVLGCQSAPDGRAAVSASSDGQIRAWQFDQYEDQRVFSTKEAAPINTVEFNSDASQLLTGDDKGVIRIWNRNRSGDTESKLEFDPRLGRRATYLPESGRIVTSSPGNVFVWQNGKLIHKKTQIGKSGIVATTRDERLMITGGDEDQPTVVWDLQSGNKVATLLTSGSRNRVTGMSISPDDRYVALGTGSVEGIVSVFDLSTLQMIGEFEEHRGWITDLVFSPLANQFISADSVEGYVNVWSIEGNQVRRQKKIEGIGGSYIRLAFSESGTEFVTSTNTETNKSELQVWDSQSKTAISKVELARPIDFVSFIEDEVVFRLTNGKAFGWQHAAGPRKMRFVPLYSNASYPTALNGWMRLAENKSLVYGNGFVRIIQAESRSKDGNSANNGQPTEPQNPGLQTVSAMNVFDSAGTPGACIAAKFADDERQVVALYKDGAVRFWDRKTDAVTNVIQSASSRNTGIDVSPSNSRHVAICNSTGLIRCFDATTDETMFEIETGLSLSGVNWNSENTLIASAGSSLVTVDIETNKVAKLDSDLINILSLDSSTSNNVIVGIGVNAQDERKIHLWQKVSGAWESSPTVFGSQVMSLKVSPDGKRVFSGDASGATTVWYIPEPGSSDPPRKLISLLGHEKEISSITLSSDGKQVATSSKDGSAILWLSADSPD